AGRKITDGVDNSFFGINSGQNNRGGGQNSFFGSNAGRNNDATYNSFFGSSTGFSNTTGSDNSFFGNESGYLNTDGHGNSFFGTWSGYHNNGIRNSFFGVDAGYDNTSGDLNSFFGNSAGLANEIGNQNSFFGAQAGRHTNSSFNNFFGYLAGQLNEFGNHNTAIGSFSFRNAEHGGSYNTAVGDSSMYLVDTEGDIIGEKNTAVGAGSLYAKTDEFTNRSTGIGYQAGYDGGIESIFIGYQAGKGASSRNRRLYISNQSGDNPLIYGEFDNDYVKINGTGDFSDVLRVGTDASIPSYPDTGEGMELVYSTSTNVGQIQVYDRDNNTWGKLHLGNGNVGIGTNDPLNDLEIKGASEGGVAGFTRLDLGGSKSHILHGSNGDWYIRPSLNTGKIIIADNGGNVGIGTDTPSNPLELGSGAHCTTAGVWTGASDISKKYNVSPLKYGLDEILQLIPKSYNYRIDHSRSLGFIAQEMEKIIPEVVSGEDGGKGIAYGQLSAILVNAIKEQQALIEKQQNQIDQQTSEMRLIKSELEQIHQRINQIGDSNSDGSTKFDK
ncbi:MAG: tail fiber domain-containing protein, partial [Saprospiraceae bacterium]|nr:tail fiber domain-containing protein [Saprospiraceae bacterium]